ncbi:MAG: DEAD/DEAH box helicase [Planctomycetota bacterium]|nr:MAG: DEAD/DEAH box helicase [Planctomycetota bacterium]
MSLEAFLPVVQAWFREELGAPTAPQREAWPVIAAGEHVLVSAPTGSGKTLAAFLAGLDGLLRRGEALADRTTLLYVSPLKALGNDVQKNLLAPLRALRARDPALPEIRVAVRSGDTPARERARMLRRPPHVLVTTPESLAILLTSDGGREVLRAVRTVVVDEIHALANGKRGTHLALSLERLVELAGEVQRIGLSATQRPLERVARFLVGAGRRCRIVDAGHRRDLDVAVEVPPAPLEAVCSHETWEDVYARMAALVEEHRTTLIFVNTRKLAERVSARLADRLGPERVTCHHGSLARERRLDAERRLKEGSLRALVATASLELGIDVGEVELVVQVGSTRRISTFLQRIGRAGHGVGRLPKGRLFPLTRDELIEAAALLRCVRRGELDLLEVPRGDLAILAQQVVAACVPEPWEVERLYRMVRRADPYRDLAREDFERVLDLHARGRVGLLHRDRVNGRVRATRRARLPAITAGGAIPDVADHRVVEEPSGALVGTVNEDFAIESSQGDVFQLGATSWRLLKHEPGVLRVANAHGAPPTLPFWLGEAPARSEELSRAVAELREACPEGEEGVGWLAREAGLGAEAAEQVVETVASARRELGAVPTQTRLVAERFFDESGGAQLVLHAPFGGRINRALGLALRKKFCRGFGFELQAAANEDAVLISLGPQHSFPLEDVFRFLRSETVRETLIQALLASPLFATRWRWAVTRSLLVPRTRGGKKVPSPLLRMRATDELVRAFPAAEACFETLPPGDIEVPLDHPLVGQAVHDCLHEAMDLDGLRRLLAGVEEGSVDTVAVERPEPSVLALGVLSAMPYAFLDDAPLEERRVQAVGRRRRLAPGVDEAVGALDPEAVARVRAEAWPDPRDAEEVHEALTWMGFVTLDEAPRWEPWLRELARAGRAEVDAAGRWFAAEASREPLDVLRGRLEVLGPVVAEPGQEALFAALEAEGVALRVRHGGREEWCHRRLLARIQRATLARLRREVEPVPLATYWRFLAAWQGVAPAARREGPRGVEESLAQLAGFEAPAAEWERGLLRARVRDYRPSYLDELTLSGRVVWGRLWGSGAAPPRQTPVCFLPRSELPLWLGLAGPAPADGLRGAAAAVWEVLRQRGALFPQELRERARLLPEPFERALAELVARGLVSCDSFAGLRGLLTPPSRRRREAPSVGRWSLFRSEELPAPEPEELARALLRRYGVVFKRVLAREAPALPWRTLLRVYRLFELRGEVRGGRFVAGVSGEQFALPAAVEALRRARRAEDPAPRLSVSAADPLNLQGVLTPEPRVARTARRRVDIAV